MNVYKKIALAAAGGLLLLGLIFLWIEGGTPKEKEWDLIYIPKSDDVTNDFWTSLVDGIKTASEDYQTTVRVMAPHREEDIERQNQLLREAIDLKPDALLISPSSPDASDELLIEAVNKGIKVIYVDSHADAQVQSLEVSTDNVEAGKYLGVYARKILGPGDQIAIMSHMKGNSTAVEREMGIKEGLGDYAANIVETVYCDSDYEKAYDVTRDLLEKYPDLKMICGTNEYGSVGAARVIVDQGLKDRIDIVGIDSSMEMIQMIEEKIFQCIVVQKPFKMGYLAIQETLNLLNEKDVEERIDSGCEVVTLENMYQPEIERLIFPFGTDS